MIRPAAVLLCALYTAIAAGIAARGEGGPAMMDETYTILHLAVMFIAGVIAGVGGFLLALASDVIKPPRRKG